jgi:protein O-mannosyl-transferase
VKPGNIYRLTLVLILAATAIIYSRSLDYGMVNWDDTLARKTQQGQTSFDRHDLLRVLIPTFSGTYQPVRELTSRLLAGVSEPDVWWPYHLVSLLLYLGTILLFYMTVRLIFNRLRLPGGERAGELGALLATAFFAFHPGHAEVAAWTLGQKDSLVGFFFIGSIYCYVRSPVPARRELVFSLLLYLLALGSKPSAICLALIPPVYDKFFRPGVFKSGFLNRMLGVYSLYFLPAAAGALYFIFTTARIGAVGGLENPLAQMLKVAGAVSFSAVKLALPVNLCLRYPAFDFPGFNFWQLFLYPALAIMILYWSVVACKGRKPYAFFACWALVALLPNMNLVPIRIERADRYYYLASMGFSALAGYAGIYLYSIAARSRGIVLGSIILVPLCLAAVSYRQVKFWSDGPAAWNRTVSIYPELTLARVALGNSYLRLGDKDQALKTFRPLLAQTPPNVEALKSAAIILEDRGDNEGARSLLELGRHLAPRDYELVQILAPLLAKNNELEPAGQLVEDWVRAEPDNREALGMLAELNLRLGKQVDAGRILSSMLERYPHDVQSMNKLAILHLNNRRMDEAEQLLERAVKINPDFTDAWMNLARLYEATGRRETALGIYSRYTIGQLDLNGLEFMGALYHEQGELEQSLGCFLEITGRWPNLARGYNNAGVIYEQLGSYSAADSLYLRAVELDSVYVDAFFNRGNLMRITGNMAGAARNYLRADTLAGGQDPVIIEALIETFRELGDRKSVNRCLGRLKALDLPRR